MLWHVAFVRTDVSEKHKVSITRVTRISELSTMLAVSINQNTKHLVVEGIRSPETSVLTRATRHKISEDSILQYWKCLDT
jgi:hypothetical protein